MIRLLAASLSLLLVGEAFGVVIVTEAGKRIAGYLVSMTSDEVVVRIHLQGGSVRTERYPRKSVTVLESFKPARLEALKPSDPRSYRDYAEELIAKKEDPEARDLALRLLILAASLDPEQLGKGCMIAAAGIARTAPEERRFRALAYLLDPGHDPALLQEKSDKAAQRKTGESLADASGKTFVAALKAYRRGQYQEAEKLAKTPGIETYFQTFGPTSHAAFLQTCSKAAGVKTPPDPTSDLAKKILRMELDSEERVGSGGASPKASPWSLALTPDSRRVPPPHSLENVTEFSPADSVFVAGKWTKPPQ